MSSNECFDRFNILLYYLIHHSTRQVRSLAFNPVKKSKSFDGTLATMREHEICTFWGSN